MNSRFTLDKAKFTTLMKYHIMNLGRFFLSINRIQLKYKMLFNPHLGK